MEFWFVSALSVLVQLVGTSWQMNVPHKEFDNIIKELKMSKIELTETEKARGIIYKAHYPKNPYGSRPDLIIHHEQKDPTRIVFDLDQPMYHEEMIDLIKKAGGKNVVMSNSKEKTKAERPKYIATFMENQASSSNPGLIKRITSKLFL